MPARHSRLAARCIAITLFALIATPSALAQHGAVDGEWRSYAGDNGSTKYSRSIRSTRRTSATSRSPGAGTR